MNNNTVAVLLPGNMFYLVMPRDDSGSSTLTDESSTDELKDSDRIHQTQNINEEEEPETPCLSPTDQSLTETLRLGQSQPSMQRHVIKNVDEIFNTMEELMRKLQHLRVKHTHIHAHTYTHTYTHTYIHTHNTPHITHTHSNTHTYTHYTHTSLTNTLTHHTHASHSLTHSHTHTHTHTPH